MDPIFIKYIKQLLKTINIKFGIMENYAFPDDGFKTHHYIFYTWFVLSLIGIVWYLIKLWNKPLENN